MLSPLTHGVTLGRLASNGLLVAGATLGAARTAFEGQTACESILDSAVQPRGCNARQSAIQPVTLAAIGRWTVARSDGSKREVVTVGRRVIL